MRIWSPRWSASSRNPASVSTCRWTSAALLSSRESGRRCSRFQWAQQPSNSFGQRYKFCSWLGWYILTILKIKYANPQKKRKIVTIMPKFFSRRVQKAAMERM